MTTVINFISKTGLIFLKEMHVYNFFKAIWQQQFKDNLKAGRYLQSAKDLKVPECGRPGRL